ncbi:MAG: CdaR family protein [Nitrospirota bacterium]
MKKSNINKFITTNPWLKLISLILAMALWFFVVSKGRSVITVDVPIGFKNVPAKLAVAGKPVPVSISIEGQESVLNKLKEGDVSVILDLSGVKTGKVSLPVSIDKVTVPKAVNVIEILPLSVDLLIEEKVRKSVPVRPIIVGLPAEGFLIKAIEVTPSEVEIEGMRKDVARVYFVKTDIIDVTGVTGSIQHNIPLNLNNDSIITDTPAVEVNIFLQKIKRKS